MCAKYICKCDFLPEVRGNFKRHTVRPNANTTRRRGVGGAYGDSMILAKCIFSQSATGEVSSAYFRKLADISRGGECKFSQTHGPPTETRLEGEEEGRRGREEEEEEEERRLF